MTFDGDGRDEEYWETRAFLLSYSSTKMLVKEAGADGEKVLEILVHAHLIGTDAESCFDRRSRKIMDEALPLIEADLEQEERFDSISTTESGTEQANHKWLH